MPFMYRENLWQERTTFLNTLLEFSVLDLSWLWMPFASGHPKKHTRAIISECIHDEFPLAE